MALHSQANQSSLRPNSINLSAAQLEALLDKLDEPEQKAGTRHKRDFVRWPFRKLSITVGLIHPGGNTVNIKVAGRNLSNGGVCVLHSSFVHPGSECIVHMPHPTQGEVQVRGKIVRCMHRAGLIHEIGIAFPRPINAKEYLAPDPLSNSFERERVRSADLQGRVLIIEPAKGERDIIKHFLRETNLQLEYASTLAEGISLYDSFTAVILSAEVGDAEPGVAASKLREIGHVGPILMIVPDDTARTRARVASAPVRAFLCRPYSQDILFRALAEVLLAEQPADTRKTSASDTRAKAAPADEVTRLGKALFSAVFHRDAAAVRSACLRIRTLSEARGWTPVVSLVNQIQSTLDSGGSIEAVMPNLELVIAACDSALETTKPHKRVA
ncbi:MAG TPA: response regulator [Phycisphaerales bacterium]|nr:response regulator [Phycisphaerales bacterium]